ncbi:MAG: GntR family transcriptional regulator [Proteobacteria bacterium]|nr:GntR family transcriptional regulator [Pseudomonadota bacterium]
MGGTLLNLVPKIPKPKPASMIIYEQLVNAIVSGEIKEGQRIVESDLTKLFDVSRSPVREAWKMLEIDGLIELIPYRGVVVTQITAKDVRENLELKGMIEGFAAWIVARMFGNEIIAQLESILAELEKHIANGKFQNVLEANIRFHRIIVENVHNEKLMKLYDGLTKSIRRFYTISFAMSSGWEFSLAEHREILNNIKAKDATAAEHSARQHAYNTINRVLARLEKKN